MQNRRNFLKSSLAAMAGAGLVNKSMANSIHSPAGEKEKFVYRTLGKTGIKIPVISMGTGNCNNPNLVMNAHDRGIKLFATSEYYQGGNNEKMIGEALKGRPRDSYMLMTGPTGGVEIDSKNGLFLPGTNSDVFLEHANGCLKRLGVDHIDILSLGFGAKRESVFFESLMKALETFKKQGKTKYIGLATHSFEPEAIRAAADAKIYDIVTVAYNFNKNNREEIQQALEYANDAGLGIIAMKTMAGAFWDKAKTQPINAQAALKWVLQNEYIHTTIPDCASFDHLEMDLAIMENLELNEKDKQLLKPPSEELSSGLYCQNCNKCLTQCPENHDIPTLMRSYMYAYGYRNLDLARRTIDRAGLKQDHCKDCGSCKVSCSMGFDVAGKIQDISRIREIPLDLIHQV